MAPQSVSITIKQGMYPGDSIHNADRTIASTVKWQGQSKGRDDHLVTEGNYFKHIWYSKRVSEPLTYIGVIDGPVRCIAEGNSAVGRPATYEFNIRTTGPGLRLTSGTICNDGVVDGEYCKWKMAAIRMAGLVGGNPCSGIMGHY